MLWGSYFSGTDSPDRFVSNDDVGPVLDDVGDSLKLLENDLLGLSSLALLFALTAAKDDLDSDFEGVLGFLSNDLQEGI